MICANRFARIALRIARATKHDVLEPLKQVVSASRDVMISGQICGSKLQRVFTLGDGCWLPKEVPHLILALDQSRFLGRGCDESTFQ